MPKSGSEVSDDFEFIETPAAPASVPSPEDYGVRTTTVSPPISKMFKANNDTVVPFNQERTSPC